MSKSAKGTYTPRNPEKLFNPNKEITFRSSWEFAAFRMCDNHPSIIKWGSENIQIPYRNPLTNKWTVYIPDLLMVYESKSGLRASMIEIKPAKEVPGYLSESKNGGKPVRYSAKDKAAHIVNTAKWDAAKKFCGKRGIEFRVITEFELFGKK